MFFLSKLCSEDRRSVGHSYRSGPSRDAVTLMETVFAIGIILTGLVGLAALIPIAADNAKATIELDRSVSESTSAAAMGRAQDFTKLDAMVIMDKAAAESGAAFGFGVRPTTNLQTIQWKVSTQLQGTGGAVPTDPIGKLDSPGYGHTAFGDGLAAGICLDPLGVPDPVLINTSTDSPNFTTAVNSADTAFDYSRFPYYNERYRILAAPNESIDGNGTVAARPLWPMSPRMWRATLRSPLYPAASPVGRSQLIQAKTAESVFRGFGSVFGVEGLEDEDPESVLLSRYRIGSAQYDSARDASSNYSWIMTLTPPFLGTTKFRQSIIVINQRENPVPIRANDPLALRKDAYTISEREDNPSGERLTWVSRGIGFSGGTGGEVLLYGSDAISDKIKTNEWVMLSRQPHTVAPASPTGAAVHRWYRVLNVGAPQLGTITTDFAEPNWGGADFPVWRRWVTLAGPDWAFEDGVPDARDDTFCTIVSGAVSVIESEIDLQF
ncbi:hypothetical protein CA13_34690 [Planctomycetes bacterium CA13]|uniref:Uncharacterized protein n=1 Tax=Novipirellula herctigrandis TaxID=2527986 RepID=A0A5C5Z3Y1_9BACT|nr:hypothetical protein CA13_34690 [Planctomycetes bacterium CA13]